MSNADDRLKTKAETARYLRISEPSLDRLRAAGEIRALKIGVLVRFTDAAIQEYLSRRVETRDKGPHTTLPAEARA